MTDTPLLLDANVLIALSVPSHVHHETTRQWLMVHSPFEIAVCPLTEGALIRFIVRETGNATLAQAALSALRKSLRCHLWSDDVDWVEVDMRRVLGHRQVTDAYLAQLARRHGGRLVTLDRGLALLHPDVALLVAAGQGTSRRVDAED